MGLLSLRTPGDQVVNWGHQCGFSHVLPFHLGTDPWVPWAKAPLQFSHLQRENAHLTGLLGGAKEITAVRCKLYSAIKVCAIVVSERRVSNLCLPIPPYLAAGVERSRSSCA